MTNATYDIPNEIYIDICIERERQIAKYPDEQKNSAHLWAVILGEEVGEVNRAILERDGTQLMKELTEVIATAVAWLEDLNDD